MLARIRRLWVTALLSALVAGCGGGGDDAGTQARKEGFWVGTHSNGMSGAMVILAHGELWSIVTRPFDASNVSAVTPARSYYGSIGFATPQPAVGVPAATVDTTFSGTGNYLSYDDGTDFRGTGAVSGTIAANGAVTARLADGNTFSGPLRTSYGTPVDVATFAGSYAGRVHAGEVPGTFPGVLTVSSDGVIRHDAGNCTFGGRIQPLTPGRQVHNAEITPVGICNGAGRSQGVAVLDTAVSPPRLYITTTYATTVGGYSFVGIRQ
jgi:hypothetical protein